MSVPSAIQPNVGEAVRKIVALLMDRYRPEKVILFGSHARGEAGPDSDVDLFILKETPKRKLDRGVEIRTLLEPLELVVGLDLIVLTPSELQTRLDIGDHFIEEILTKGIVLHG